MKFFVYLMMILNIIMSIYTKASNSNVKTQNKVILKNTPKRIDTVIH